MLRTIRIPKIALRVGIALCLLLVFAVDCFTRRGLAVSVAYVGAVWLGHLDHHRHRLPLWVAAASSILLLLGAFLSPGYADPIEVFLNRGLVLTVIWLAAYVSLRINGIERLLGLSEWRTRAILESALDAVIALDERGRVTVWNERATRLFGWSPDEALGQPLEQLILPPDQRGQHFGTWQTFLSGNLPIAGKRLELHAMRRDGTILPIEMTVTAARTNDAVTFSAFARDITQWRIEEQQHQRALAEVRVLEQTTRAIATAASFEQSLKSCLEAVCREAQWPVGHVWLPDPTRRWVVSTDIWYVEEPSAWTELLAASQHVRLRPGEGLAGKVWEQLAPVWHDDLQAEPEYQACQLGRSTRAGFAFPVALNGRGVAVLEFFNDRALPRDENLLQLVARVSERIAEIIKHQSWEEQRARLAAIVDTSYDAIIGRSLDGTIISWNRGAERMYGYTEEEALGQTLALVQGPDLPPSTPGMGSDPENWNRVEQLEILRRRKDGKVLPVSVTMSPIIDSAGRTIGTATIERDIAERKRTEAELRKAKDAAESASQARSEFLANVSHELRTPINAMLGMTQLALEEALAEEVRDYILTARASAESLLVLLNDILDFSRLESGKFRIEQVPFTIRDLVDETVRALASSALEKGLKLACDVDAEAPPHLVGDPVRLRQILTNLLTNAIKFTETGEIVLSLHVLRRWPQEVRLKFAVRDTGIGISLADQQRIFEPFTQADSSSTRRYGGTGLGLTICTELLRLMGGRLNVESEPGQGSEFSFLLSFPLPTDGETEPAGEMLSVLDVPAPVHDHPPLPENLSSPPSKLTVLLAEDTPANQKVVTSILQKRGHEVTVAQDGREALEMYADHAFDVVLMDVQMPQLDGYRATEAIRRLERERQREPTPIIALTAHAMRGDRERCLEAGMDAYLAKPVDVRELLSLVESLADKHNGVPAIMPRDNPNVPPIENSPINLAAVKQRLSGDLDLFHDFVRFFMEDAPGLMQRVEAAIKSRNAETLYFNAHGLKGLAANVGAEVLAQEAGDLERMGKEGDLSEIDERLVRLRDLYDRATTELAKYSRR